MSGAGNLGTYVARAVSRHWHGRLPIAVSSLAVGLATYICIYVLRVLTSATVPTLPTAYLPSVIITFYVLCWTVVAWWSVGAWRSANGSDRPRWRTVTKLLVATSLLLQVFIAVRLAIPSILDASLAALDDPEFGARGVRTVAAGNQLELFGEISNSTPEKLEQVLNSDKTAALLRLVSDGGRVGAAQRAADIVRRHHLDTYVEKECDSACTILFLAGTRRWIRKGARLGFHASKFGGVDLPEDTSARLAKAGVPQGFIHRVQNTPSNAMWYPTEEDLLAAHVVTGVVALENRSRTTGDSDTIHGPVKLQIYMSGYTQFGTGPAMSLSELQTKLQTMSTQHDCPDIQILPQIDAQYNDIKSVLALSQKFGCSRLGFVGAAGN